MFVGVEQNSDNSPVSAVRAFATQFGWTFPVVRDDPVTSTIFLSYETARDNYIIVDREGKIAYKATNSYTGGGWFTYGAGVHQALANLGITPIESLTWGRIKSLY